MLSGDRRNLPTMHQNKEKTICGGEKTFLLFQSGPARTRNVPVFNSKKLLRCYGAQCLGIQLAHVETTTEFDQLAPLLGRGPNAVQLIAVHAELCARVQGIEHFVLGQDIGPGSPEEGGELLLLVGRGRQVLGLGQRGLVGDGVVVVVNELLQTSTRDEYGTNKSCETSLRQCHEESYYLPAPRAQR